MSGGAWNYAEFRISELADNLGIIDILLRGVARTEHVVDWAESCDTSRKDAEIELYDLWLEIFEKVFGIGGS